MGRTARPKGGLEKRLGGRRTPLKNMTREGNDSALSEKGERKKTISRICESNANGRKGNGERARDNNECAPNEDRKKEINSGATRGQGEGQLDP